MSSSLGSITINGIAVPYNIETTSGTLFSRFEQDLAILQSQLFTTSGGPTPPLTNFTQVQNAITDLRNLMVQGDQSGTVISHMTLDMLQRLKLLFDSLGAAGVTVPNDPNTPFVFPDLAKAQDWQNIVTSTAILQNLFNTQAGLNTRSLQAMIELDYVRAGNELIFNKMTTLQSQLQTTKDVLNTLGGLQNIHNQVVINNPGSFTSITQFNWGGGPESSLTQTAYEQAYLKAASAYYSQPISPILTTPTGSSYYVSSLYKEFWDASAVNPVSATIATIGGKRLWGIQTLAAAPPLPATVVSGFSLKPAVVYSTGLFYEFDPSTNPVVYYNLFNTLLQASPGGGGGYTLGSQVGNYWTLIPPDGDPSGRDLMKWSSAVPTGLATSVNKLVAYRQAISSEVTTLSARNGTNAIDPSSLLGTLKQVLTDLQTNFQTTGGDQVTSSTTLLSAIIGFKKWMLDNYNQRTTTSSNLAGIFQQNITSAITAGQSTNDQQSESVRQFLYVFEQFYQSAAAMLQQITQIIQQMAQGINR